MVLAIVPYYKKLNWESRGKKQSTNIKFTFKLKICFELDVGTKAIYF